MCVVLYIIQGFAEDGWRHLLYVFFLNWQPVYKNFRIESDLVTLLVLHMI